MNTSVLLSFVSNKKTATNAAVAILTNLLDEKAIAGDSAEDVQVVLDLLQKYTSDAKPGEKRRRRTKAEMLEAKSK